MFTAVISTMYSTLKHKNQNQHFHMLCAPWEVALPTTLMALPTYMYHTWQSVLSYYFVQVVNLTERPTRRNYTFMSSIGGAPSRPGIVRTRKRVESGEMCEIKQII
jgi:hypothetical protein